jgi:hypothetical protein
MRSPIASKHHARIGVANTTGVALPATTSTHPSYARAILWGARFSSRALYVRLEQPPFMVDPPCPAR